MVSEGPSPSFQGYIYSPCHGENRKKASWNYEQNIAQSGPSILETILCTRAVNKSSSSEPSLAQIRFIKIWVKSSQARKMFRAEKSSSNSVRYYLS
jgi:hypothetical protein